MQCDDGNRINGDGCSSNCINEKGYACTGGSPIKPDSCVSICGDGFQTTREGCDDGNTLNGDGCSSNCTVEKGFSCTNGTYPTSNSSCHEICGDGLNMGFL